MRYKNSFLAKIGCLFFFFALFSGGKLNAQDTISNRYVGYRLQLIDFEQVKKKGNQVKLKCTVVNTGRFAVKLDGKSLPKIPLVLDADLASLKTLGLENQAEQICRYARIQKINLEPGGMIPRFTIQFILKANAKYDPPQYQKLNATNIDTALSNPKTLPKPAPLQSVLATNAPANPKPAASNTETVKNGEKDTDEFVDERLNCADLALEDVKVLSLSKKNIEIEFTIVNKGVGDAPLFGAKKGKEDNVAIQFYLSSSPRLTRGSVALEGVYVTQGLEATQGKLAPNGRYRQKAKINIEKASQFSKVLILYVDNFDVLRECDETNNEAHLTPNWLF
ncbi:MAG: hypothetical protein RLZZ628_1475 [Bacteroidota bacterium]|jgi:hypothetical protein